MVWVLAGLALTEMLAVAATAVAVAALWAPPAGRRWAVPLAAAGGLLFGVGVLSRPQFLVVLPLPLVMAAWGSRLGWAAAAAFTAAAAAVCGPVFAFWGDVVPPAVSRENYSHAAVSVPNVVLASGYAGGMLALLAPRWFRLGPRWAWGAVAAVAAAAAAANLAGGWVEVAAARGVADWLLPPAAAAYYPAACGGAAIAFAVLFWSATAARAAELRAGPPAHLAAAVGMAVLVASTAKISHQFSSRYVAVAVPFMVLAAAPYRGRSGWEVVRVAAGGGLGAVMLLSYLRFAE